MLDLDSPPANVDAEMGVLGSILIEPERLHDVRLVLKPDDFWRDDHAIVYRTILSLADSGRPVDAQSINDELARAGHFERLGGYGFVVDLAEKTPHAAHAGYYANLVRQKAVTREVIAAASETIRAAYSNSLTAEQLLAKFEAVAFGVADRRQASRVTTLGEAAIKSMELLEARRQGDVPGLQTGFLELDAITGGLQRGWLYVVAGRPSMGKTALAFNVADHVSTDCGKPSLFASLEMSDVEIADRALAGRAEVGGNDFRQARRLTAAQMHAIREAYGAASVSPLYIDDTPGQTLGHVASAARRHRSRHGIELLVVDYLQLLEHDDVPRGAPRHERVAAMSRGLKQLARELEIPVVLLSQLNRLVEQREDHRPRMSDLRESGAVEQDANVVLLIHRPEYYDPDDSPGIAEVIVAKNRGGPTDTVKLRFDRALTRFRNLAEPNF